MKLVIINILILCVLTLSGCKSKGGSHKEALLLIQSLSNGKTPSNFAGSYSTAIEILQETRKKQNQSLSFEVREGDAPLFGDGSCQFHILASAEAIDEPFIGIRLKSDSSGWHIAGYWTP